MLAVTLGQKARATAEQDDGRDGRYPVTIEATYFPVIGGSNVPDARLEELQGGEHEPGRNGRPLHLISVAPSLRFTDALSLHASFMGRITTREARALELEEGYLRLTGRNGWPGIRVGKFYTDFGRINPQHFEDADFVDKPVIHKRILGPDVLAGWGISAAWPLGAGAAGSISFNAQNPGGNDAASFLFHEGENHGGRTLTRRRARGLAEWLHLARWQSPPFGGERGDVEIGLSLMRGPNASGRTTRTSVVGADFLLRAWPREKDDAKHALTWHGEWLARRYEAGDPGDPAREVLRDKGWSSQWLCGLAARFSFGLRLEGVGGRGGDFGNPERDARRRAAVILLWQPRADLSLRAQFNRVSMPQVQFGRARILLLQLRWQFGTQHDH